MSIVESILAVFTAIGDWFVTTLTDMLGIFYNATDGLTVLGVLAVCALGISVIMLIINVIRNYFRFR